MRVILQVTNWLFGRFSPRSKSKSKIPGPNSLVSFAKLNELNKRLDLAWVKAWNDGEYAEVAFDSGNIIREFFDDNWILPSKGTSDRALFSQKFPLNIHSPYFFPLRYEQRFMDNHICGYIASVQIMYFYGCAMFNLFLRTKKQRRSWLNYFSKKKSYIGLHEYIGIYLPVNSLFFDVL